MNKKHSITIPCLLLTAVIFSCGYYSTSNYLPHIDTINIPLVTVETPEVDIGFDEQVTQALRDKFRSKWQEGGDSVLTMTIKDYRIDPISFDANNQRSYTDEAGVIWTQTQTDLGEWIVTNNLGYQKIETTTYNAEGQKTGETIVSTTGENFTIVYTYTDADTTEYRVVRVR